MCLLGSIHQRKKTVRAHTSTQQCEVRLGIHKTQTCSKLNLSQIVFQVIIPSIHPIMSIALYMYPSGVDIELIIHGVYSCSCTLVTIHCRHEKETVCIH